MKRREVLRIIDANFNRSREGLRVCEEITRFILEDRGLTADLKKARHAISDGLRAFPVGLEKLVAARNTRADVGKGPSALEGKRKDARDLFLANLERVKESLRVLEETSKFIDDKSVVNFKMIRFKIYAIEKKALPRLEALRHHRPQRRQK